VVLLQFFDQDGSGFITREEMVDQFRELGGLLDKAEIELFHDILDSDGNGVIDVRSTSRFHVFGGSCHT
jgi:Ca2+-binding EF-hand superfamily protein